MDHGVRVKSLHRGTHCLHHVICACTTFVPHSLCLHGKVGKQPLQFWRIPQVDNVEAEGLEKNVLQDISGGALDTSGAAQQKESLLVATAKARKEKPEATEAEKRLQEEEEMLRAITQKAALKSVKELAKVTARCCDRLPRLYTK
jgi:hypothetical protein